MDTMSRVKKASNKAERLVIGYVRVSTDEQTESGAGLEAQRRAIIGECERNGWTLVAIIEDAGLSAKSLNRPGLREALDTLTTGGANVLMAAKLDRLSRSTRDVCELGDMASYYGFDLSLLDARIDTTTPHGRAQLSMMATFAQLERELIGLRTREALAVKKAQGVKLGRSQSIPAPVQGRILAMREQGQTLRAIADTLNAERVDTGRGGKRWYASTVKAVTDRAA